LKVEAFYLGKITNQQTSQINAVKAVFDRYAKDNNVTLTASDLDDLVNDIIKNVRLNPLYKKHLKFPLTQLSVLDDTATQIINIADNIKEVNLNLQL